MKLIDVHAHLEGDRFDESEDLNKYYYLNKYGKYDICDSERFAF